jgi:hypothetical protein
MTIALTQAAGMGQTTAYNTAATSPKVMVNADTVFTAVGDIEIIGLWSECQTVNDATASTLQWQITPTVGTATTISGATTTLASLNPGATVVLDGGALATAPIINPNGPGLHTAARGLIFPSGVLKSVVGVGSTTGTWRHYIDYVPLEAGAYVIPAF